MFADFKAAGIGEDPHSRPCVHLPQTQSGMKMGVMIDIDGTLVRVIENEGSNEG
jgi:hypothetical protein